MAKKRIEKTMVTFTGKYFPKAHKMVHDLEWPILEKIEAEERGRQEAMRAAGIDFADQEEEAEVYVCMQCVVIIDIQMLLLCIIITREGRRDKKRGRLSLEDEDENGSGEDDGEADSADGPKAMKAMKTMKAAGEKSEEGGDVEDPKAILMKAVVVENRKLCGLHNHILKAKLQIKSTEVTRGILKVVTK